MNVDALKMLINLRFGAQRLRSSSPEQKNKVLLRARDLLLQAEGEIIKANKEDLRELPSTETEAFRDRLMLDDKRIKHMAESLAEVAALKDPVGEEADKRTLKNGLKIKRVRSPLGVIFMIFESRPNVATEAFSLAFKSGNAIILRGGSESMRTTAVLYRVLLEALSSEDFKNCLWGITDSDRALPGFLMKQPKYIDIVVPRGGDGLINFVTRNSSIPIIKNDRGLCHVYVHGDADLEMAASVVVNAKTQRPGVCNSMETVLIHKNVAGNLLPTLYEKMESFGVDWYLCPESFKILKGRKRIKKASGKSWDTEYLDFDVNCHVVGSLDDAIRHIEDHGSRHSESIITKSEKTAREFQARVDAAAVYWNASTRFTDGFEFGLGGELGISTQKLHVRGPVGLNELTSYRWIIDGQGQIRT